MMSLLSSLNSIIIGLISGIIYGLFFLVTRRRVFRLDPHQTHNSRKLAFTIASLSFVRVVAFGLFVAYLLLSPSFNFILILPCFLIAFWLTILTQKAYSHGRF